MKRILSVILAAVMLLSVMAISVSALQYTDVNNHWGIAYIDYWTKEDGVDGYPDNTFRPDRLINRAEVLQVIANVLKLPCKSKTSPFTDLKPGVWYYDAIIACYDAGIVVGFPDKTVRANDFLTREQAITIVARVCDVPLDDSTAGYFIDKKQASEWALSSIGALFNVGVLDGYTTAKGAEVRPLRDITRAEFVKLFALVDQNPSFGYSVGNRVKPAQIPGEEVDPSTVAAIIGATGGSSSRTYYTATVELREANVPEKKLGPAQISVPNETGATPILFDLYKSVTPEVRVRMHEVFGDDTQLALNEMSKIANAYIEGGMSLTEQKLADAGVNPISYNVNGVPGDLNKFLGASYQDLTDGDHAFRLTVGERTYGISVRIDRSTR